MPTITMDKQALLSLIGVKLSDDKLVELINSLKPEVEEITENEITIEFTPDRPDMFSLEGLARAIRLALGLERPRKIRARNARLSVKVEKVRARPFVACAIIRGAKLNEATIKNLMNFQEALHQTIGRNRRKVAIGLHDLDKIKPPIKYCEVSPETKLIPLGWESEATMKEILQRHEKGVEFAHLLRDVKGYPAFVDELGVFSFPPIINSKRTMVTEKTRNFFLDMTATDETALDQAMRVFVANLAWRGWRIEKVILIKDKARYETPNLSERKIEINASYVNRLLGLNLKREEIESLLKKAGYRVLGKKKASLKLAVPPYRVDVLHPVDVVEDVAIIYGYSNFEPRLPNITTIGKISDFSKFLDVIRELCVGAGLVEVMLPVLAASEKQRLFCEGEKLVMLENPVSRAYDTMRCSLLPGLLDFLAANKHEDMPQRIFEIGRVVEIDEKSENKTRETWMLACVITDYEIGYEAIASVLDAILRDLVDYKLKRGEHKCFIKGRVASVLVSKEEIGKIGEIHPGVLLAFKLESPVVAFEINLTKLFRILRAST